MKIAISVTGSEIDAALDARFGRALSYVLVDTETEEWQGYANPARDAAGGAGIRAAEFVIEQGVEAVISGAFGPNAYDVLEAAGVKMYRATSGTAADLVQKFKDGDLELVEGGPGRGAGRGRGGGRGRLGGGGAR